MTHPKLAECPFCNNAPRHLKAKAGFYTERVICDHCHFHLEETATQTAVERWNTRLPEESKHLQDLTELRLRQPLAEWVMVPVEPTKEMIEHAHHACDGTYAGDVYRAMLAAAPKAGVTTGAALGGVYAELPEPTASIGIDDAWHEPAMRDFADRTYALRMEQAAPKAAPLQQEWRLVLPGGKHTDEWESARVGDYNRGWNDYRKAAIAALNSVVWPARASGNWVAASTWLRNNYQDYPNITSLCDAMLEAAPKQEAQEPATVPYQKLTDEIDLILSDPDTELSIGAKRALLWVRTWVSVPLYTVPQPAPVAQAESSQSEAATELPPITNADRQFLHDNPNTDDLVKWVQNYARLAIGSELHVQQPYLWVSPEQAAKITDHPPGEGGRYLPVRKSCDGKFTEPLYRRPPKPQSYLQERSQLDAEWASLRSMQASFNQGTWVPAEEIKALVRQLDVLLNGEAGAAKQATLGDLISQVRRIVSDKGNSALLNLLP